MRRASVLRFGAAAFFAVALSGCVGMTFPVSEAEQAPLSEQSVSVIRITPENVAEHATPSFVNRLENGSNPPRDPARYEYAIGPGDVLNVRVWSDPERSQTPGAIGLERPLVVDGSGEVVYPFVGPLSVDGRSAGEVRDALSEGLTRFVTEPQVEVDVAAFNARTATITGRRGARLRATADQRPRCVCWIS
jgi:Periplasmic protein involved in polysaccharide export